MEHVAPPSSPQIESQTARKLRGGYYTPEDIAAFLSRWAIRKGGDNILEPSCGDGAFIRSALDRLTGLGVTPQMSGGRIIGVELDPVESEKAKAHGCKIHTGDFFSIYKELRWGDSQFDVVLGNPPFIRYQHFEEGYRRVAFELMEHAGFHPNRLTNIWVPFLLLSSKLLSQEGRLAMVIPAELFQVNYAHEAREFLCEHFSSITVISFKRLMFPGTQQEVVLLLAERSKEAAQQGIRVIELNDSEDLLSLRQAEIEQEPIKKKLNGNSKWQRYYLGSYELGLLDALNHEAGIAPSGSLFEANVGVVSGENGFFVLTKESAQSKGLLSSCIPIISRSFQVEGLELTSEDFLALSRSEKKVYLFAPGDVPLDELPLPIREYIASGETDGIQNNYKCRIRKHWYSVPVSWTPDAFFLRQVGASPRIVINTHRTLVTDTLHKIRFLKGIDGRAVAAAFNNSYTYALSETLGRSYGGGVLTFEPSEVRMLRIPMLGADKLDFEKADQLSRNGNTQALLDYIDSAMLEEQYGLSKKDIQSLRGAWATLRDRRLARKVRGDQAGRH